MILFFWENCQDVGRCVVGGGGARAGGFGNTELSLAGIPKFRSMVAENRNAIAGFGKVGGEAKK